jgi:hypothetical protein
VVDAGCVLALSVQVAELLDLGGCHWRSCALGWVPDQPAVWA